MTLTEFADLLTLSQMTPGPIAINAATFVGIRVAGLLGAIVASFGMISPALIIVLGLAYLYKKFQDLRRIQDILSAVRPAAVGLIASAGLGIIIITLWPDGFNPGLSLGLNLNNTDLFVAGIFIAAWIALRVLKVHFIFVILAAGLLGFIKYALIG
ncbi:MAG: chromate transporter, partial [Clostridiales bacterium]|jgi:chromate transporter|nr:chromate transporter [Clostridiales bacterium]